MKKQFPYGKKKKKKKPQIAKTHEEIPNFIYS